MKKPPHIPKDTCPYIDLVKSIAEEMSEEEDADWRLKQLALIDNLLEYIRDSNYQLRQGVIFYRGKIRNNNT